MKNLWLFLFLPLLLCFSTQPLRAAEAPSPFSINGWQLHEYNLPKLEDAVNHAPEYGVNFLIFSHEFFRSVEGFLASTDDADPKNPPRWTRDLYTPEYFRIVPGWQSDLRHIGDLATAKGIPYYLWVHELDDIPRRFIRDKRVDMDDPALYTYLDQRYERLLKAVPGAAGFVLTLHESDFKVFRDKDVSSNRSAADRIHRIATLLHDVLKRHGKQLILRNFFYEPAEMGFFKEAVDRLSDDVIVMSKDTTHEFHPFYPWDPVHGQVGKKKQIIEIDLGVEKAWSTHGAYAQTDFIRRVAQRARDTKLVGLVGRARLHNDNPFADSHEVNLYAFSRYLQNPDLTVEAVLRDWAVKRYPAGAVPHIVSAMKRTEFINHHGRWHLEYWFTKSIGTEWADYPYYFSRVLQRSRYKWTHEPADKALEEKLYHPDLATFNRLLAEKDEVIKQTRDSIADLRQAARYCRPEKLAPLQEDFRFLLDAALLQREWVRAYFAQRMYVDKPSPEARAEMEDALVEMQRIERTPGITYGMNADTGRRYNIDGFDLEMRWRVANRERAAKEDKRILEDARKGNDVINQPKPDLDAPATAPTEDAVQGASR